MRRRKRWLCNNKVDSCYMVECHAMYALDEFTEEAVKKRTCGLDYYVLHALSQLRVQHKWFPLTSSIKTNIMDVSRSWYWYMHYTYHPQLCRLLRSLLLFLLNSSTKVMITLIVDCLHAKGHFNLNTLYWMGLFRNFSSKRAQHIRNFISDRNRKLKSVSYC